MAHWWCWYIAGAEALGRCGADGSPGGPAERRPARGPPSGLAIGLNLRCINLTVSRGRDRQEGKHNPQYIVHTPHTHEFTCIVAVPLAAFNGLGSQVYAQAKEQLTASTPLSGIPLQVSLHPGTISVSQSVSVSKIADTHLYTVRLCSFRAPLHSPAVPKCVSVRCKSSLGQCGGRPLLPC